MLSDRLARAALAGIVAELGAADVLARLLGRPVVADAATTATVTTSQPTLRVEQGVVKVTTPGKQGRPKPGRPSRAKPKAEHKRRGPEVVDEDQADVQRLTVTLIEAHGGMVAAERATSIASAQLARWRDGKVKATPATLERLRDLVAEAKRANAREEEDDDAGADEGPAGEDDPD